MKRGLRFFMITHRVITHFKTIEKKSLRHAAMVAKFLDLNQQWSCKYGKGKKIDMSSQPFHSLSLNQIIKSKRTSGRHAKKNLEGALMIEAFL